MNDNIIPATGIPFTKMTGTGNDFIIIDNFNAIIDADRFRSLVPALTRRALSIGADGVIILERSEKADFRWRFFNADGSEAEMCGNGSRCASRFAFLNGLAPSRSICFETIAGIIESEVDEMGARIKLRDPFDLKLAIPLPMPDGTTDSVDFINTGVPHAVLIVDEIGSVDVPSHGKAIRTHAAFAPKGTNADFIGKVDSHTIRLRTYERGVESETFACGTGAVASAIIATLRGLVEPGHPVTVLVKGGKLEISFRLEGQKASEAYLSGDARIVYTGVISHEAIRY